MADKVLHEVRIIETDDGFRIEVRGDKKRMREMGFGPGCGPGFGPLMGFMWHRGRRGRPGFGPWWWGSEPTGDEAPPEEE